jgi:metal-sulfur cluster biosynthetic enzyme
VWASGYNVGYGLIQPPHDADVVVVVGCRLKGGRMLEEREIAQGADSRPPPSETDVFAALRRCYDPCCKEKQISVVDMGLVDQVRIDGAQVGIDIILTSGWCPFSMHMLTMMEQEVGALAGVDDVKVTITWGTVWSPERLSESARAKLRLPMEQLLPLREARLAKEGKR